jgi:hypothetical protein
MLKVKTESFIPILTALFFALLVIYLFSQDASLPGPI